MGQRSLIILRCENPVIKLEKQVKSLMDYQNKDNSAEVQNLKSKLEVFRKAFGDKRKQSTCYYFYNQWCFGRSFLLALNNILAFASNGSNYESPFGSENNYTAEEIVKHITNILSMFNSKLAKKIGRFGIERFHLLNFTDDYILKDFRSVENNDGVGIIDLTGPNPKYCFLSIGGDATINQLTQLEPVSASKYVQLYYPETTEDSNINQPVGTDEEIAAQFLQNKRLNRLFKAPFQSYEVLTTKELRKIFPDVYKKKDKVTV